MNSYKTMKDGHHYFPEPKVKCFNILPFKSLKPQDVQFTMT